MTTSTAWRAKYDRFRDSPFWLWIAMLLLALGIMLPPALLMGATFPYLVRAMTGGGSTLSRPVGRLYGMNTLGAIAGAASGGLFLLPMLHLRGALLVAVSINLFAAWIAGTTASAVRGRVRSLRLAFWSGLAVLSIAFVHWRPPPWDPLLMTSAPYLYVTLLDQYVEGSTELRFYDEGLSSVVTVVYDPEDANIYLANNGKVDASLQDMETQLLLAHLPGAFRP